MEITRDALRPGTAVPHRHGADPQRDHEQLGRAVRHPARPQGPQHDRQGSRAAGLFALRYALRLLSSGRARSVLCGGAEELTPERAWLEYRSRRPPPRPAVLGEGCSLLLLEPEAPADAPVLAEVLGVTLAVLRDGDLAASLTRCLLFPLAAARGATAADLWAVSPSAGQAPVPFDGADPLTLPGEDVWGTPVPRPPRSRSLRCWQQQNETPAARGRIAAVLADRDNVLGCALFRLR